MLPIDESPTERSFGDDAARIVLGALPGPYLPWGSGAMRPAGLVKVCNDIVLNERGRIVELGSGISTVLLARLLHQREPLGGAHLVAVEHDDRWARWVTAQLAREGLADVGVVVHAPLRPHPAALDGLEWYDATLLAAGLDAAFGGDLIDLLVVDGPPAYAAGCGMARYPALPAVYERLAAGATVVLDDIERLGERAVLERWQAEFDLGVERHERHAGIAVGRVG